MPTCNCHPVRNVHAVFCPMNPRSGPHTWQWPDHVIGKRESRRLREEHNRVVNLVCICGVKLRVPNPYSTAEVVECSACGTVFDSAGWIVEEGSRGQQS
jgi:hypothetical protein